MRMKLLSGSVLICAAVAGWWALQPPPRVNMKPLGGDFWAIRVAYPTMHFSPGWYVEAKAEDALVASAVPAGDHSGYLAQRSQSPLSLDPDAWTFIGPRPKEFTNYGKVTGRINVIAVDPDGPDSNGFHTVYAAADGGGVWKSSNCCDPATSWAPVTDQPDIASIAIGDLHIDPNDSSVIYAGTGDLRYGSFSFGSAGLLKSSDRGAS